MAPLIEKVRPIVAEHLDVVAKPGDAGVSVHVLRRIAGHGSLTTTQRYLHPETVGHKRGNGAECPFESPTVPRWSPATRRLIDVLD